jgi:hypothetical protein
VPPPASSGDRLSRLLVSILTSDGSPWLLDLGLDWRLVGFTVALAIITCVIFRRDAGLARDANVSQLVMRQSGRGMTADRGRFLIRRTLVVGQIAISLVLVVGALLFVGTLRNLATVENGFSDRGVLQVDFDLRPAGVASKRCCRSRPTCWRGLRALPACHKPRRRDRAGERLRLERVGDHQRPETGRASRRQPCQPRGFFDTLKIPFSCRPQLRCARQERDDAGGDRQSGVRPEVPAGVESRSDDVQTTGRSLAGRIRPYEVIGVVGNTKYRDLREALGPQTFFPDSQDRDPVPFQTVLLADRR